MEQGQPQTTAVEAPSQGEEALQRGLANRTKTLEAVNKARVNLGQVAAGHEVHTDMQGNILGPQDLQELREKGPAVLK